MRKASGIFFTYICALLVLSLCGCKTIQNPDGSLKKGKKNKITAAKENNYLKRDITPQDIEKLKESISIFTKEIEANPRHFGAYYNRAIAYFFIKEYDKSWQDVCKVQLLGGKFNSQFLKALKEVKK